MKKFTFLLSAMLLACATFASESGCYTLTPATGENNSYASNCDITIAGITWNLTGNSKMNPWRIGGKNLSKVDRTLYSKTPLNYDVTKIVVTHGAATDITVNSFTLLVAGKADFLDAVSYDGTFVANSTATFTRPDGADWNNKYYKFVYNVTVKATDKIKFIEFTQAEFYYNITEDIPATAIEVAPTSLDLVIGEKSTLTATLTPANATDVVEWTTSAEGVATVENGEVTAVGEGTAIITATVGEFSATCEVTVEAPLSYAVATDATALAVGDVIVLGCKAQNAVAGAMGQNAYFAKLDAVINEDGNLKCGDAIEITLGGYPGAWMLQTEEGFVGCTGAKSLSTTSDKRDSIWTIAISNKTATITNHTAEYGTIKYNSQNPRFTTYASGQKAIEIYVKPTTTPMYVVTVAANNPEYGSVLGGGNYREGTTAVLTAVPAEGYKFTGWSNNAELSSATQTFTVTESVNITANFAKGETAIDNAVVETPALKTIENGQLVILRDGVKYNAMGVRLQ